MILKDIFFYLTTSPCSPRGRAKRIEHLMKESHRERDFCAIIVYSRDIARVKWLNSQEWEDVTRIAQRIEKHELVIPGNWNAPIIINKE